ncbi:glycerophosphoryl diester phosphodiesterase [Haladaptatus litoreus]|uniref:Glycerophosphoryl diester phosphodiesterase n=1 Tax=Haladaptatus litoreus TaxID=553468 RepID=A0A1N6YLL9_9EURY|nr:glycerophosphodiester phosphodiesterase family protein [Haladaptatus litoreus]SIR15485.1 glycerophosphoryl diester phosphodiesterase [Haladaptatus litoreus]
MARTSGTTERQSDVEQHSNAGQQPANSERQPSNIEHQSSTLESHVNAELATTEFEQSVDADRQSASTNDLSIIAHRGFAGVYPENTIGAVKQATAAPTGAPEMIEIDVHPTVDGEIIVFHDTRLDRLTDASGTLASQRVWNLPYDDLRDVSILGTEETIPRLETFLDAVPSEIGVNVEFKNPGTLDVRPRENLPPEDREKQTELWRPFAERVLSTLADYDHEFLISSFGEGALAAVRELDSKIPIAAVFAKSIVDGFEIARRYDCDAIHPPWNMIAGTELFNDEYGSLGPYDEIDIVDLAHEEGYDVNVWTVESWYQATQLHEAGVDGIIADYPNVLRFSGR